MLDFKIVALFIVVIVLTACLLNNFKKIISFCSTIIPFIKKTLMKNKKSFVLTISSILFILVIITYGIITFHDYMLLKNSGFFADGPVGYAAQIPPTVHAYKRLRANPFAEHIFKNLEKNGTNSAKAYAIIALKDLNPKYAKELQEKYAIDRITIDYFGGCIISPLDLDEIFEIDWFFIQWLNEY